MTITWNDVETASPELAARVRRIFDAGTNKTLATLRRDGSPRISAIEVGFDDGVVSLGMMGGSMKLHDVRRDPRVALHSPTVEDTDRKAENDGDAKLAGRLVEVPGTAEETAQYPGAGFFHLDVREVTLSYVGEPADHMVIESWHPDRGWTRRTH